MIYKILFISIGLIIAFIYSNEKNSKIKKILFFCLIGYISLISAYRKYIFPLDYRSRL